MTPAERVFLSQLLSDTPPFLDVWLHDDNDGTPWLIASLSFGEGTSVHSTLRLDFDGASIRGGWSQYNLNGDDGVRASDADVDFLGEDGIDVTSGGPEKLAALAREWFEHHSEHQQMSNRPKPNTLS